MSASRINPCRTHLSLCNLNKRLWTRLKSGACKPGRKSCGGAVPLKRASLLAVRLVSLSHLWLLSEVVVSDRRIGIGAMAALSGRLLVPLATICVAEAILFSPHQARREEESRPEEFHPRPLAGRVGDWRAGLGRSLCSPLTRSFVCECHTISTLPRFQPPPRRTQRTCGRPHFKERF
jgi:hypothetical protein